MALMLCPHCKKLVSSLMEKCPFCRNTMELAAPEKKKETEKGGLPLPKKAYQY